MRTDSKAELCKTFTQDCIKHRLPAFERDLEFTEISGQKWRVDFCALKYHIAIDIREFIRARDNSGLNVIRGDHVTLSGLHRDMDRGNALAEQGFSLLLFDYNHITSGEAVEMTRRVLKVRGWQ
jgi:hypothetical protein